MSSHVIAKLPFCTSTMNLLFSSAFLFPLNLVENDVWYMPSISLRLSHRTHRDKLQFALTLLLDRNAKWADPVHKAATLYIRRKCCSTINDTTIIITIITNQLTSKQYTQIRSILHNTKTTKWTFSSKL